MKRIEPEEAHNRRIGKSDWMEVNVGNTTIKIVKNDQEQVTVAEETTKVKEYIKDDKEHVETSKIRKYYKLIP